ncbi:peripheral myelin protein 22-like [Crassostrea angulata]|uniref:peripheral myelin protein 22-like n=1 Tax=Magallana angulata TaxID=2784310 RepID=UPI0022B0A3CB|nr:peripheral myelin protein 22-like [Crassostrea angulata]
MACGGNSCYFGFGLFLLILGLVIDVIGVASPYWILADEDGVKVNGGLWQMCTSASDVSECSDFTKVQDWLKAVRGFGILGILLLLIAVLTAFVRICMKDRTCVLVFTIVLSFMAAVCIVISVSVFGKKYNTIVKNSSIFSFHYAFVSCILSIIISVIAGIFMIVEVAKRSPYTSMTGR